MVGSTGVSVVFRGWMVYSWGNMNEKVKVPDCLKWNIQIRDLNDERYRLNEPLLILIEEHPGEDNFCATFSEVEAFGEGKTEVEATLALKQSLIDLYDELTESDYDSLGPQPRSWLRVIRQVIRRLDSPPKPPKRSNPDNQNETIEKLRLQCIMIALQTPDEGLEELYDSIEYICDFYLHSAQAAPTEPPNLKEKPAIVRDVVHSPPFPLDLG